MSSRDNILNRIRAALKDVPAVDQPPVPEVWPRTDSSTEQLVARFTEELEAVAGEVFRCHSMEDAQAKLGQLIGELDPTTIGAVQRPVVEELTSEVSPDRLDWGTSEVAPQEMAQWLAGLVAADYLLADTGTCMVTCGTPHERMMCYLPPVCIVVARTDQLVEHMPAAWDQIAPRVADPDLRGEFVFITGPSRTADIEKILILGVHGPKRLIVLLVG